MKTSIIILLAILGLTGAALAGFYFGRGQTKSTPTATDKPAAAIKKNKSATTTPETKISAPKDSAYEETPASTTANATKNNTGGATTTIDQSLSESTERFTVAIGENSVEEIAADLLNQGFINDKKYFVKLIPPAIMAFTPGGYKLSKTMSGAQIAETLQNKSYMVWVIIPEGLRKEETADLLASDLNWNITQKEQWINKDTAADKNYFEGVYFPDTYLIPADEAPADAAKRLIAKFNERFAVYLPEFNRQNIKWTTGLTFASIVQREAANAGDMPLIAGILWNRIEQGMALDADATLQYARGNAGNGWWTAANAADKQIDSPYNTYANKGLPPHPICSPGTTAIKATLNPAQTDCLYYLHDNSRITHCSKTYEEHLENIEKYLK